MTTSKRREPPAIRALATVTLDPGALDELPAETVDRLADLVAKRLADRRAAGEEPLLTATEAAELAGVHVETVRRAIRSGALVAVGHAGQRPRLRREDIENWLRGPDEQRRPVTATVRTRRGSARSSSRVLTDTLNALAIGARS